MEWAGQGCAVELIKGLIPVGCSRSNRRLFLSNCDVLIKDRDVNVNLCPIQACRLKGPREEQLVSSPSLNMSMERGARLGRGGNWSKVGVPGCSSQRGAWKKYYAVIL